MAENTNHQFDPHQFLAKVGQGRTIHHVAIGEVVFAQGDVADAIFFIQQGKVKITVVSDKGKEAIAGILEANDFVGEGCLIGQALRIATVKTLADCVIVRIDRAAMNRVLRDEPAFSALFIAHLVSRNIRVEADLVDQLFNSSEKRLARTLLLLANFGKEGHPEPISVRISQESLADMIGTTRSRVSHFMNKFRRLGFINYNGGIHVRRSLLNAVLHEKPAITADEDKEP